MGGLLSLLGWIVLGLGVVVLFRRLPQFGLTARGHALALIVGGLLVLGVGARIPGSASQGPSNGDTRQAIAQTPTTPPTQTQMPKMTVTPVPTPSPTPTVATPPPTQKPVVVLATAAPTARATAPPPPPPPPSPPPPPAFDYCGAPSNPWHYNFCGGNPVYSPPSTFCNYFDCIASFWTEDIPGDGYVIQCMDGKFSLSGGEAGGVCSYHGGPSRPLDTP
jgi:hypothetical protein